MDLKCSKCVVDMGEAKILLSDLVHTPPQPTKDVISNGSLLRDHFALHSGTVLVDITNLEYWDLVRDYDEVKAKKLSVIMLVCSRIQSSVVPSLSNVSERRN